MSPHQGDGVKIKKLHISLEEKTLVDISLEIRNSLALVGQSGSGKSLTLKALLSMLPKQMECELDVEANFALEAGKTLSLVVQNPFTALSPLTKIKKQFFVAQERIEEIFEELQLDLALLERYPPELSGGQLQRVVIAIAISHKPKLLLLDEPTTALDPKTTQAIIQLLKKLQYNEGFKMLFVTHDITSAQALCEDICVINNGVIVECGSMDEVISKAQHSYTKTLIEANFAQRNFRQ